MGAPPQPRSLQHGLMRSRHRANDVGAIHGLFGRLADFNPDRQPGAVLLGKLLRLVNRAAPDPHCTERTNLRNRLEMRHRLFTSPENRQPRRMLTCECAGSDRARSSGSNGGDLCRIHDGQRKPIFSIKQHHEPNVRRQPMLRIVGEHRENFGAQTARIVEVARHHAKEITATRQLHDRPQRHIRAPAGQPRASRDRRPRYNRTSATRAAHSAPLTIRSPLGAERVVVI